MNEKRIALWDNLKLFLIIMVVLGHSLGSFILEDTGMRGVYIFIYSFHMPAFFLVSGLFSKRAVRENDFYRVTPYLLLYLLIKLIAYFTSYAAYKRYVPANLLTETDSAWFCLSLFFMYIITMYVKRFKRVYILCVALFLSCIAGYFSGNPDFLVWLRTVTFYPFFYLGYILNPDRIAEHCNKTGIKVVAWICLGAVLAVSVIYNRNPVIGQIYNFFTGRYFYSTLPDYQIWGGIFRLGVFFFSLFLIFLLISIMPKKKLFFSWIGQRTLAIYVFHGALVFLVFHIFGMKNLPEMLPYGWQLIVVLLSILISVFCSNFLFNGLVKGLTSASWRLLDKGVTKETETEKPEKKERHRI